MVAAVQTVAGCGGGDENIACTDEARSSVTVAVVDAAGATVTDAQVQFSVDGAAAQNCDAPSPGVVDTYTCGYEIEGHFVITATRAASTGMATVDVAANECHVAGREVTLTLSP